MTLTGAEGMGRKVRAQGLSKAERLHGRTLVGTLFNGGVSRAVTVYPLRAVYMAGEGGSGMLVSVPKRLFRRAVKRNRVKRLVREAYRRHKGLLDGRPTAVAFIWLSDRLESARVVDERVARILSRIGEGRPPVTSGAEAAPQAAKPAQGEEGA